MALYSPAILGKISAVIFFLAVSHQQGFVLSAVRSHLGYWAFMMTIQSVWTEQTHTHKHPPPPHR